MIAGFIFLFMGLLFTGIWLLEVSSLSDDWWYANTMERAGIVILAVMLGAIAFSLLVTGVLCVFGIIR